MTKSIKFSRTVGGVRPRFFETAGVDEAMMMVLTLAQELMVLRERMDSAERVANQHGFPLTEKIEALAVDEGLLREREEVRQKFFDRLFQFANQRRAELEAGLSDESYAKVIADLGSGT